MAEKITVTHLMSGMRLNTMRPTTAPTSAIASHKNMGANATHSVMDSMLSARAARRTDVTKRHRKVTSRLHTTTGPRELVHIADRPRESERWHLGLTRFSGMVGMTPRGAPR